MSPVERELQIKVVLLDDEEQRAGYISDCLLKQDFEVGAVVADASKILKVVSNVSPDVIIINLESPSVRLLESIALLTDHQPTSVLIFLNKDDPNFIQRAIAVGVSNILVGPIDPAKLKPQIDVALAYFGNSLKTKRLLEATELELAERLAIDQAKLLIIQRLNLDEKQAYEHIRREAMNSGSRVADVAKRILDSVA